VQLDVAIKGGLNWHRPSTTQNAEQGKTVERRRLLPLVSRPSLTTGIIETLGNIAQGPKLRVDDLFQYLIERYANLHEARMDAYLHHDDINAYEDEDRDKSLVFYIAKK
jgi:hypothetical protein